LWDFVISSIVIIYSTIIMPFAQFIFGIGQEESLIDEL